MCQIRTKFWITSLRSLAKKILRKCVICKLISGRPYLSPLAPPLPGFRLNELNAFDATAMDFTSHLYVKNGNEVTKVYVALFTCCSTRAVELEIVNDMTVVSFLRAFRRFSATYSTPKLLYCDNARTFTSADDELKRLYGLVSDDKSQRLFAEKRIRFVHTPVQASWFGGVHERMIGVCKSAIKKTLGKSLVPLEELQTIVKEVQAIVNNRPLTYTSSDIDEIEPITPNHLIFGREIKLVPWDNNVDLNEEFDPSIGTKPAIEKLAHRRAQLIEHFRKRFYDEYLATLRERHCHEVRKQNASEDIIKIGDVVLVHDKDEPRVRWKLGVVQSLIKGQDSLTRAATVKGLPTAFTSIIN